MRSMLLVAALAAPAFAQPAPSCDVTIARAPDDVRAFIAGALVGEHCHTPLEVRAIPVEGGFYLFARDPSGRVRERIVPDARGAGTLVAAWAAEAGAVNWAPELDHFTPNPAPPHSSGPAFAPPSSVPVDAPPAAPRAPSMKQLEAAGLLGSRGYGARIAIDVAAYSRWTFGAAAALSTQQLRGFEAPWYMSPYVDTLDTRAVGYAARTWGEGSFHVRAGLGVGIVHTIASTYTVDNYTTFIGTGTFPFAEGTVILSRDLGASWGIDAGLAANAYNQTIHFQNDDGTETIFDRHGLEWQFLGGIRYRL